MSAARLALILTILPVAASTGRSIYDPDPSLYASFYDLNRIEALYSEMPLAAIAATGSPCSSPIYKNLESQALEMNQLIAKYRALKRSHTRSLSMEPDFLLNLTQTKAGEAALEVANSLLISQCYNDAERLYGGVRASYDDPRLESIQQRAAAGMDYARILRPRP
jgi:hypothetical protein